MRVLPPRGKPNKFNGSYDIHFRRFSDSENDFALIAQGFKTLEDAKKARSISGDLVVYGGTRKLVKDEGWLWDWERKQKDCYAQNALAKA